MLNLDKAPMRPTDLSPNTKVPDMARERWNEQNKDAIAAYNQRIESEGLPLARYRTFAKGR